MTDPAFSINGHPQRLCAASALGGAAATRSLAAGALPCLRSLREFPFTALCAANGNGFLRWGWMGGVGWGRVLDTHSASRCVCPRRGCCYPFTRGRGPPLPSFTAGVSVHGALAPQTETSPSMRVDGWRGEKYFE